MFTHTCSHCGADEERILTDSWTGKELCLACLLRVGQYLTNSPRSEGDNLEDVLEEDDNNG